MFSLTLSQLILSKFLLKIGIILLIPTSVIIILMLDSISKESVDPIKLCLIAIVSTAIVFTSLDTEAILKITYLTGEEGLNVGGSFRVTTAAIVFLAGVFFYLLYS